MEGILWELLNRQVKLEGEIEDLNQDQREEEDCRINTAVPTKQEIVVAKNLRKRNHQEWTK